MRTYIAKWLLLAVFLFLPIAGYAQPTDANDDDNVSFFQPSLRVGLFSNQPSVRLSADADFDIADSGTGKVLASFSARDSVTVSIKNGALFVNGSQLAAASVDVVVRKNEDLYYIEQHARVNERRYRGDITVRRTAGKSGLTVVNTLPVEQYLYGVIKNEISPDWPLEAVKAQAVAARTYALASTNKHKADGFDVCTTVDCQVYGGRESEAARALEAVDATRGLVLLHSGKLITAYFHSSAGGYTENSENVWSTPMPYLRGVVDYDRSSPAFSWQKKFAMADFDLAVRKAGYNIGKLQTIELSRLSAAPVVSEDRGVSGRVKTIRLTGTGGSVLIPGTKLRTMLDLRSTLFDIELAGSQSKEQDIPVSGTIKRQPFSPDTSSLPASKNTAVRPVSGRLTDLIIITGFGWGHGLGMSQWGAKAMAEQAPPADTEYFKAILQHYYQGVQIKKAYI